MRLKRRFCFAGRIVSKDRKSPVTRAALPRLTHHMKLAVSLIPLLTACVVASPDGIENEAQVDQALGCQAWGCGTNSPIVGDGLMFDELDSSG